METHLTPDQRKQYEESAKNNFPDGDYPGDNWWLPERLQQSFLAGCEHAHSKIEEAEREAWNRAIDEVSDMVSNAFSGRSGDDLAHAEHEIIEELKKLRK